MCFLFHMWTNWVMWGRISEEGEIQIRNCTECGKMQARFVEDAGLEKV